MYALSCILAEEAEEERKRVLFRDYVGQALWDIDRAIHAFVGAEISLPQYVELSHKHKPKEMTAEEIKQYVLERLKE